MNLKGLFNMRDLNYWLLASGIGLSAVWTIITLIVLLQFLVEDLSTIGTVQLILMTSIFIGNFITGWITGKLAADLRGPTYGVVSSLASVVICVFVLIPAGGIFGLLTAVVAVAGGFNGGLLTLPRIPRD